MRTRRTRYTAQFCVAKTERAVTAATAGSDGEEKVMMVMNNSNNVRDGSLIPPNSLARGSVFYLYYYFWPLVGT